MAKLSPEIIEKFEEIIKNVPDQTQWDIKMNDIIGKYI
jgi:hypothetical protein